MKILISACLLGIPCRYDGNSKIVEKMRALTVVHDFIPICPEQLGGLPTPRAPSERVGNKVFSNKDEDVTLAFERGANATLEIAKLTRPDIIILKEGSPSCGVQRIYDGTFTSSSIHGKGVTADLLTEHGFIVISEETPDFEELLF